MGDIIRTQTNGRPTWSANAGVQAIDIKGKTLYVNLTSGAADWAAIPMTDLASAMGLDSIEAKFRRLLAFMADQGFDVPPGLEKDTERGLNDFEEDLEDLD